MKTVLKPNGELVTINNHNIHIYRQGNINRPKLIFMSGSGTVAPVYDFKVLYEKLQNDFRIIVIEKFGYGYSDIFETSCDIDSLVSMQKQALELAGEKGPYILVSHSMSGLEAIRWKQKYPENIQAIIGIDMATPLTYGNWTDKEIAKRIKRIKRSHALKFYKIPGCYPLNNRCLTEQERKQQKLLMKRNAFNHCYSNEAKEVLNNAKIVSEKGKIDCPILLFSSNGKETSKNWAKSQQEFAAVMSAKLITYNCGHYMHYYKSHAISREIKAFIKVLSEGNMVTKKENAWKYEISGEDGYTNLFDVNIFDYEWIKTGETVRVVDPLYGQKHIFTVYNVFIEEQKYEFAAGEFSNTVFGFYVREGNRT